VTYAGYWIRAFILEAVVRSTSLVGGGSGPLRSKLFFRLRRERARVETLTTDPDKRIEMMAERFDTTPAKMEAMLRRIETNDVSLDQPVYDESQTTLVETLESNELPPDEAYERDSTRKKLRERLEEAMNVLDRRERLIVEQRILSDEDISLAALGRELGVSRERARQLEARAKAKLRNQLKELAPAA